MTRTAPRPNNFEAMADAWDDPVAFAAEMLRYYTQLESTGHRTAAGDVTESMRTGREGQ